MPVTTPRRLAVKRATALGSYWVPEAAPALLRARLRDCATTRLKVASIGGDEEGGFEQSFASLAYSVLKDKAPRLLDFIIGFQLVDRNEDNTKAVGVFGFKVGNQWLYVPAFFLNGALKGQELLYLKDSNTFVPLKENWVNYIIARKPQQLGEPSQQNAYQMGGMMPNLSRLIHPPIGSKYGADAGADNLKLASWVRPFLPALAAIVTGHARAFYPEADPAATLDFAKAAAAPLRAAFAGVAAGLDLRNFLADLPRLKTAYDCCRAYPAVKRGFDRFYGPNFFAETARRLRAGADSLLKRAEHFVVPPPKAKKKKTTSILPELPGGKEALDVIALDVRPDDEGGITENVTDEERERLVRDGAVIRDRRDSHAVSEIYNTQVALELTNPDSTGLFEVLEKPSKFDTMLVLKNPHTGRGREDFSLVVRKSDPRAWKNVSTQNLWVKQNPPAEAEDYRAWWAKLPGVTDCKKGGTYVALGENGDGTCPFRVREDYGDDSYNVSWEDHVAFGDRPRRQPSTERGHDYDIAYSSWDAKLTVNHRRGSRLRSSNGELSVPEGYKVLKIADPPKEDDCTPGYCPAAGESAEHPIQPGNLVDVQLAIQKQAALAVQDLGAGEVLVTSRLGTHRLYKTAAVVHLVRDHGLREGAARVALARAAKEAAFRRPARFHVKYAYGYGTTLQEGPDGPGFPEPPRGSEAMGPNSVNSIYPQEETLPVEGMQAAHTDPSVYDPWYMPDQQAMQMAQQASASGQKEVFDTSMLSGLLKTVRHGSLVERHLGDLMKAINALGTLLFSFYWHQEDFRDDYGKQDLPEIEDGLRNVFEGCGDITLKLLKKSGPSQAGLNLGFGTGQASEPDITEVARN